MKKERIKIEDIGVYLTFDNKLLVVNYEISDSMNPRLIKEKKNKIFSIEPNIIKNEIEGLTMKKLFKKYQIKQTGKDWNALLEDAWNLSQKAEEQGDVVLPLSYCDKYAGHFFIGTPLETYYSHVYTSFIGFIICDKKEIINCHMTMERATEIIKEDIEKLNRFWNGLLYSRELYNRKTGELEEYTDNIYDIETISERYAVKKKTELKPEDIYNYFFVGDTLLREMANS